MKKTDQKILDEIIRVEDDDIFAEKALFQPARDYRRAAAQRVAAKGEKEKTAVLSPKKRKFSQRNIRYFWVQRKRISTNQSITHTSTKAKSLQGSRSFTGR